MSLLRNISQNFLPKLRAHLLPRIQAARVPSDLALSNQTPLHTVPGGSADLADAGPQIPENVLFKFNRLYFHNTMRINYTTYDIRQAQDTINTNTEHRDVMVLSKHDNTDSHDDESSAFIYARVLGICHVNVIQTGTATPDYTPKRLISCGSDGSEQFQLAAGECTG